jgi:hypothetical protein
MNHFEHQLTSTQLVAIVSDFASHAVREQAPSARENSQAELDRRLDQALEETFPASDPVSVMICL